MSAIIIGPNCTPAAPVVVAVVVLVLLPLLLESKHFSEQI